MTERRAYRTLKLRTTIRTLLILTQVAMAIAIHGKVPNLVKVVFELRYYGGFTYLDRCGRTINSILELFPEWVVAAGPNPQVSSFINVDTGAKFSFSSHKLDLTLDRRTAEGIVRPDGLAALADEADELTAVVTDLLGLADFARIGCRCWYLFAAETMAEAQTYIESLGLFEVSPSLALAFGGAVSATSLTAMIDGPDRTYRFAVDAVERTLEVDLGDAVANVPPRALITKGRRLKPEEDREIANDKKRHRIAELQMQSLRGRHPGFAVTIDVDAFADDPIAVKPREYITSSMQQIETGIRAAASRDSKA